MAFYSGGASIRGGFLFERVRYLLHCRTMWPCMHLHCWRTTEAFFLVVNNGVHAALTRRVRRVRHQIKQASEDLRIARCARVTLGQDAWHGLPQLQSPGKPGHNHPHSSPLRSTFFNTPKLHCRQSILLVVTASSHNLLHLHTPLHSTLQLQKLHLS